MSITKKFWQYIGTRIANSFEDEWPQDSDATGENQQAAAGSRGMTGENQQGVCDGRHGAAGSQGEADAEQGAAGEQTAVAGSEVLPAPDVARELLASIGCICDWREEGANDACDILYQGGHFLLRTWRQHHYCLLTFPFFFSTDIDELDIVRSVINRCNMESILTRVIFSQEETKNEIHCHVLASVMLDRITETSKRALIDLMTACFGVRRDFDRYIEEARNEGYDDPEQEAFNHRRDAFLISEQARVHGQEYGQPAADEPGPLTLGRMLRTIYDWDDVGSLTASVIVGDRVSIIDDASGYDPIDALATADGEVTAGEATLLIRATRQSLQFTNEEIGASISPDVRVVAMLRVTHADERSVYVQATLTREPASPGDLRIATHPEAQPDSVSLVIARDLTTDADRHAEYEYMLTDAHDKTDQGHENELTDAQRYILVGEPLIGDSFNLYWGCYYARRKRYLEALPHFENIYGRLREQVPRMTRTQRASFFDIMYYIGQCHARLGHYQRAFYYLDAAAQSGNTDHLLELINLLVNSHDPRTDTVLNNVISNLQQQFDEADDNDEPSPEAMQHFAHFINMRRAYYYIEMRRWNDAQGLLNHLMKDEATREFATNEQRYMNQVRKAERQKGASNSSPDKLF